MDARTTRVNPGRLAAGAGLSLGGFFGLAAEAEAEDFTVSNTADAGAGSLREALTGSNNNNSPTVDRILFQAGLTGTISLASPLPLIDEPLQVLGPGADRVTISGNNSRRSFAVINSAAGDDVLISGLRLASGDSGGNIGGAILSDDADLTLESVTISGNDSGDDGAGVAQNLGTLTIRNSTISGNDAAGATSFGGGVWTHPMSTLLVQNSTISGNDAERGGGMYLTGVATIESSTIADNGATNGGGIYEPLGGFAPTLTNTIVADNGSSGAGPDHINVLNASFTLVEQFTGGPVNETVPGSNIIDDVTDGVNDVDPQLGVLGPNGGTTQTHALPQTSLAVDKGMSAGPTDQRGQPRPSDFAAIANSMAMGANGADMGAFELQVPPVVPIAPALPAAPTSPGKSTAKKKCKKKKRAASAKKCRKKK